MDEGYGVRLLAIDKGGGFGLRESVAPGFAAANYGRAVAAAHFDQALGEVAGGEDGEFLIGLDEIREHGFHAGAAGAGDHLDEGVLGAEDGAEVAADFFVDFEKERVEVADYGLAHGFVDARVYLGGSGSEEQATWRF